MDKIDKINLIKGYVGIILITLWLIVSPNENPVLVLDGFIYFVVLIYLSLLIAGILIGLSDSY